jgi:Holliday junction DNA helicase RuvB
MHFKPYTEEEFVSIAVEILDREEGLDRDVATIIAEAVFNRLESTNIRECIRIARLTHGDIDVSKLDKILETFAKYGAGTDKTDQA